MPSETSRIRLLGPVAACLCVSGMGSLVLEVVWSRLLKLVFGSTTLAIATILVAYMLGLGLGGLLGGRWAERWKNGVRAYGLMELGIGAYALAVPSILELYPLANRYLFASWGFWPAALGRFVLALFVLLLPTMLMGATLPVLVQALVRGRAKLARGVGLLYGINTLGAVLGVVVATFVLFPLVGLYMTNVVGAVADIGAGVIALALLAPRVARAGVDPEDEVEVPPPGRARKKKPVEEDAAASPVLARWNLALIAYGLVGFTSLSYEVAWTRALSMICGSSVYAFATMLAAFLTGIALGSLIGRYWFDRLRVPLAAYSAGIGLLGVASLGTLLMLGGLHDMMIVLIERFGMTSATLMTSTIALSFLAMLAPTLILGALFPLLTRALAVRGRAPSSTVGDVYFVNTIGSAAGAFCAGFLLIPLIGLRWTMVSGIVANLLAAALLLVWQRQWRGGAALATAATAAIAAVGLLVSPPAWQAHKMSLGPFFDLNLRGSHGIRYEPYEGLEDDELLFYEEGFNTTVSVHRSRGYVNMRVNGKVDASIGDMSTQVISGVLPFVFGGRADDVLVIGYASGVTVGCANLFEPETLDVVELESAIMDASRWFDEVNHRPLEQKNVNVIVEDGRTWLSYADETYDVIISEPSNPWITGASNLFTREFLEAARARLKPGGRLLQWIQLYGLDPEGVSSVIKAIDETFPHVYGFLTGSFSGDLLLIASLEPLTAGDLPRFEELDAEVQRDLQWAGIYSTADLWTLLRLNDEDIGQIARQAPRVNTDGSMFVELRAPWRLYDTIDASQELISRFDSGLLPLIEGTEAGRDPELLGALAVSYVRARLLPELGVLALGMAEPFGESATALVAEAELAGRGAEANLDPVMGRYARAIEMDPDGCVPRLYRAPWAARLGRPDIALADFDVAQQACPPDPRIAWGRMRALIALQRFDEALAIARAAAEEPLATRRPEFWTHAAEAAAGAGDPETAVEWLLRSLNHQPGDAQSWATVATLQRYLGREDEAARAERNAEIARINGVRTGHRAALTAYESGDLSRAAEIIEWVVEQDPTSDRAKRDRDRIQAAIAADG